MWGFSGRMENNWSHVRRRYPGQTQRRQQKSPHTLLSPSYQPTAGYFYPRYYILRRIRGYTAGPRALVTAGNGVALISMAVLIPALFRRLDSNKEKAERSSRTSCVLRHHPERTCV